jgi:nucleotide-binding universal stress UspA family protein
MLRILVAVDGSENALRAVRFLISEQVIMVTRALGTIAGLTPGSVPTKVPDLLHVPVLLAP